MAKAARVYARVLAWWITYLALSRAYRFVYHPGQVWLGAQQYPKPDPPIHFLVAWPAHICLVHYLPHHTQNLVKVSTNHCLLAVSYMFQFAFV